MPKVFISWSGQQSRLVANALHQWLPVVLQSIKPFISSEDLRKGGRWVAELSDELEKDSFGIVCLTPTNLSAPWILFEAGALSKSVGDSQVAPFLAGVKPSELPAPLTQFNAVLAEKEDFARMIKAINERIPTETVSTETLQRSITACWPAIEAELTKATATNEPVRKTEPHGGNELFERFDSILQELLLLNRSQSKILSSPQDLFSQEAQEMLSSRNFDSPLSSHPVWSDIDRSIEFFVHADLSELNDEMVRNVERLRNAWSYAQRKFGLRGRESLRARRPGWARSRTEQLEDTSTSETLKADTTQGD